MVRLVDNIHLKVAQNTFRCFQVAEKVKDKLDCVLLLLFFCFLDLFVSVEWLQQHDADWIMIRSAAVTVGLLDLPLFEKENLFETVKLTNCIDKMSK